MGAAAADVDADVGVGDAGIGVVRRLASAANRFCSMILRCSIVNADDAGDNGTDDDTAVADDANDEGEDDNTFVRGTAATAMVC